MPFYCLLITLFSAVGSHPQSAARIMAIPAEVSAQANGWHYEKTVDRTGATVNKAVLTSTNLFQLAYPYSGGTSVTLTLRAKAGDTHAYLEVSKGMFTRSFQSGSARVGFNSQRPVTYALSAAANGRANIVFFDAEKQLINQIKKASTMTVELQFAGQTKQVLRFNTTGLRWSY